MSEFVCRYAFTAFPESLAFAVIVYIGFGFFDYVLVPLTAVLTGHRILPDKARRNTVLTMKDKIIVQVNRLVTVLFLYHMVQLGCNDSLYSAEDLLSAAPSWQTAARAIAKNLAIFVLVYFPAVIVFYDFFYALFHRALHLEWLYPHIHKHHHLQYTPWRGNVDAINTHPIEYIVGEYNHLWSLYWVAKFSTKVFGYQPHAVFVLVYIVVAGLLSTLNHTRVDARIPYIYNVWWHDLHHRVPPSNYGQYTMLWDWVFGWYKDEGTKSLVSDDDVAAVSSSSSAVSARALATSDTRPSSSSRKTAAVRSPTPKKSAASPKSRSGRSSSSTSNKGGKKLEN